MMGPMHMDGLLWGLVAVLVLWLAVSGCFAQLLLLALLRPRRPTISRASWLGVATAGPLAATLVGVAALAIAGGAVEIDAHTLDRSAYVPLVVAFPLWGLLDLILLRHTRPPREDYGTGLSPAELRELRAMRPLAPEAVYSLALALAGFLVWCFPASLLAVYFGAKVRAQERKLGDLASSSATMALVGIWLGTLVGVPTVVAMLGYFLFYAYLLGH